MRGTATDLVITHRAKHVLEQMFDIILAFAIEESSDAGYEGGTNDV